jgi:hypothetical protein
VWTALDEVAKKERERDFWSRQQKKNDVIQVIRPEAAPEGQMGSWWEMLRMTLFFSFFLSRTGEAIRFRGFEWERPDKDSMVS